MEILHLIICAVIALVLLGVVKHMFFKRTAKFMLTVFVILVLFLIFGYTFKSAGTFQENKFVQTGAVVAEKIVDIFKEKVDTESLVNSTVKSNKLFKS